MIALIGSIVIITSIVGFEAVFNMQKCDEDKFGYLTDAIQWSLMVSVGVCGAAFIYVAKSQRSGIWMKTWKQVSLLALLLIFIDCCCDSIH